MTEVYCNSNNLLQENSEKGNYSVEYFFLLWNPNNAVRHRREIKVPLIANTHLYFSVFYGILDHLFSDSALGVYRE
jgi:hypothetical protein